MRLNPGPHESLVGTLALFGGKYYVASEGQRLARLLAKNEVITYADVSRRTAAELLKIRGISTSRLTQLVAALRNEGYELPLGEYSKGDYGIPALEEAVGVRTLYLAPGYHNRPGKLHATMCLTVPNDSWRSDWPLNWIRYADIPEGVEYCKTCGGPSPAVLEALARPKREAG